MTTRAPEALLNACSLIREARMTPPARVRLACVATVLLTGLAGCADMPAKAPTPLASPEGVSASAAPFDASAFAWSVKSGAGSIHGSVIFKEGAAVYSCASGDVILTPETPWTRRRMLILYGSATAAAAPASIVRARTPSTPAGDYVRFVRRTTCDESGRFQFSGLPAGTWFVVTLAKPISGSGDALAVLRSLETRDGDVELRVN